MSEYTIINADDVDDVYAGSDVPGEFRPLSDALGTEQVAVTLIRVPPHCDFEQGTGHYHEEQEELYLVTRGTLTMRFGDDIRHVGRRVGRAGGARGRRGRTATRATSRWRCGRCRPGPTAPTRSRSTTSGRRRRTPRRNGPEPHGGVQDDPQLRRGLDALAREQQRHGAALRPALDQVAVVRAGRVARLARVVHRQRAVPRADVDHLAERGAGGDLEERARVRRRPRAARRCCSRCRRRSRRRRRPARGRPRAGGRAPRRPRARSGARSGRRAACPTPSATSACRAAPRCGRSRARGSSSSARSRARRGWRPRRPSGCSSSSRITVGSPGQIASTAFWEPSAARSTAVGSSIEFQTSNSAAAPESGRSTQSQSPQQPDRARVRRLRARARPAAGRPRGLHRAVVDLQAPRVGDDPSRCRRSTDWMRCSRNGAAHSKPILRRR